MTRLKSLLLSEIFPPRVGGSARYLWETYRRMPEGTIAFAVGEGPGCEDHDREWAQEIFRIRMSLTDIGFLGLSEAVGYIRAIWAARRAVAASGTVRIICARCVPEGWIALALKKLYGLPFVCHAHGEEVNRCSDSRGAGVMSSRQVRWMARQVMREADFLIANSHNTARILTEQWGVSADRIRVLHPGVDSARFRPESGQADARTLPGWSGRRVILTVGRLQRRKGHDRMIDALPVIRRNVPDVLYAIVGDGPERGALEQQVERNGLGEHVQFLGGLGDEDMIRCYQQCDIFALPNRQVGEEIEGFGLVLLEAQACGRPVIAGASGGTSEAIRVSETGLVVDCEDLDALAGAVIDLLGDRERSEAMGRAARLWAVEFDWSAVALRGGRLLGVNDVRDHGRSYDDRERSPEFAA